jgi:NAD(P)H-nitrite reductase large subunit
MKAKYVIVGGSAAGIAAVEAIREVDPSGEILLVSEEPSTNYSRPMISELLAGETNVQGMKYREDIFWEKNNVHVLIGKAAVRLNVESKVVELDDGVKVEFDRLLLATGGRPYVPKIEGINREGVFTFTTLSDAERLAARIKTGSRAVVIGGGLIGVSAAEALVKRGVKVTVVEFKHTILNLILDETASRIVENAVRKSGVEVVTGQTVQRVIGNHEDDSVVGGAVLTNGEHVPCEVIVIAIGVVPRTELAVTAGLKTNRGILVDSHMRTSAYGVYAAGDVAEAYDFVLNENRLLALWPLAVMEGRVAGYNMAGKEVVYAGGTSMSTLKYFGVPVVSVGVINPKTDELTEVLTKGNADEGIYKKLVLREGRLEGFILVKDIEKAGILTHLVKNKTAVEKFKHELLSDDFGLVKLPPSLRRKLYMRV